MYRPSSGTSTIVSPSNGVRAAQNAASSGVHASPAKTISNTPLWQLDMDGLRTWILSTHALFPRRPKARLLDKTPPGAAVRTPEGVQEEAARRIELMTQQRKDEEQYAQRVAVANVLLKNLQLALQSASVAISTSQEEEQGSSKRAKTESGYAASTTTDASSRDIYNILDPSFSRGKDVIHVVGAMLSRLTIGGLMNALSGTLSGVVDVITAKPLPSTLHYNHEPIPTAGNLTIPLLHVQARNLSRALNARLEMDMLNSTPARIVEMLCPEVSLTEITSIRKRIYDTVVLGRGTNASLAAAALEGTEDLPVSARAGMHDIDKFKKCKTCGNNDQSLFALDRKNGDEICTVCGTVASESIMHEGSQFRKFEGEADRNHHGDIGNPLYSNAHNMSTTLGGMSFQTGAGMGGFGSQGGGGNVRNLENVLRNAHAYTEMNISQFGKEEKKTRVGYKDRQKKDAFVKMTHIGDALSLHEAVVQRAKELFAGFRDDRELVQQFKGVVAACLCEAFDQLSKAGRQILRIWAGEEDDNDDVMDDPTGVAKRSEAFDKLNMRACRRSELHSASLAGKKGLLIDMPPKIELSKTDSTALGNGEGSATGEDRYSMENKPCSVWDLDDCRSWLLEASRTIARQWSEQQNRDSTTVGWTPLSDVPNGSLDELEGKLVEHTLVLCDLLENEMKVAPKAGLGLSRNRVTTPRVNEMGRLGIKWQHSHERGSGGAGGVGNNAQTAVAMKGYRPNGVASSTHSLGNGRTAGQILILKTAKKLGAAIHDEVAGEAFHRELRALQSRQEARKKSQISDESALQRFNQMKRKPWLLKRAEGV